MKKALIGFSVIVLTCLSACTPANPPQANTQGQQGQAVQQSGYGFLGAGPINFWAEERAPFHHEGEENHSSFFRTLHPERNHLGDDRNKIREIVYLQGLEPGVVVIAGSHAWVNVNVNPHLSKNEQQKKIQEVRKALREGVPRYQIHVNGPDERAQ